MTLDSLRQYRSIGASISALLTEIDIINTLVSDVRDRMTPADIESAKVLTAKLSRIADDYKTMKTSIEDFIDAIPDDCTRKMFEHYTYDGLAFEEIGDAIGYDRTSISRRMKRYIVTHN